MLSKMSCFLTPIVLLSALCPALGVVPFQSTTNLKDKIYVGGNWYNKDGSLSLTLPSENVIRQYPTQIFSQCTDHFTPDGCGTSWNQRFWTKDDHYEEGGPIFVLLGGEAPADQWMDAFTWGEYAETYSAKQIVLEHRFYGESFPVSNPTTPLLEQLFTSQQTLADIANFVTEYKTQNNLSNSKWVLFGLSYSATLAAWFKQQYPDLVTAVMISSGPLTPEYDYRVGTQTMSQIIKTIDEECFNHIHNTFECMESIVNGTGCGSYTDPSQIPPALVVCEEADFTNRLSSELYFFNLIFTWGHNYPQNRTMTLCESLRSVNGTGSDILTTYGKFLEAIGEEYWYCNPSGKDRTREISDIVKSMEGKQADMYAWLFQTCFEFGYNFSSDRILGLFGYDLFSGDAWGQDCAAFFGPKYTREYMEERIALTNEFYKAKELDVKCAIFTNGDFDVWHLPGIIDPSETSVNNTVIFIPQGEHCDDLQITASHKPQVLEARRKVSEQLGVYLNDPNCQY